MKTIIIVSKCLTSDVGSATFELKAHFKGAEINRVHLYHDNLDVRPGEEYLIYTALMNVEEGKLTGKILKLKPLEETWK